MYKYATLYDYIEDNVYSDKKTKLAMTVRDSYYARFGFDSESAKTAKLRFVKTDECDDIYEIVRNNIVHCYLLSGPTYTMMSTDAEDWSMVG